MVVVLFPLPGAQRHGRTSVTMRGSHLHPEVGGPTGAQRFPPRADDEVRGGGGVSFYMSPFSSLLC